MIVRFPVLAYTAIGMIALAGFAGSGPPQEQQAKQKANTQAPERKAPGKGLPDLVGALKGTKGCLGVETAKTSSGKNVIFAWFEDKQAVLRW